MKLVIPSGVRAGHLTFDIVFSDKPLRIADVRAQVNHTPQIIRLSKFGTYEGGEGFGRSTAVLFEMLLHELLHIHNHLWCGSELTEMQIEAIASGLTQSLLSLGLEPDFSQVPEERV